MMWSEQRGLRPDYGDGQRSVDFMTGSKDGIPGVFLDRDGTLVREVGYLSRSGRVEILPRGFP